MLIKVEIEGQTYEVKVLEIREDEVLTEVDGKAYGVKMDAPSARPKEAAPQAEMSAPAQEAPKSPSAPVAAEGSDETLLKSPLPGTIVEIKVKVGQTVKNGDVLMILEAMKMKNSIRATRNGTVAEILVNSKDQVKHNQPLLRFGD